MLSLELKKELDYDPIKHLFLPPDLGTVLYMPGLPQGGGVIHDRSPYGNHGTIDGPTWDRNAQGLWYLDHDGTDDYVDCGSDASLLPNCPKHHNLV